MSDVISSQDFAAPSFQKDTFDLQTGRSVLSLRSIHRIS